MAYINKDICITGGRAIGGDCGQRHIRIDHLHISKLDIDGYIGNFLESHRCDMPDANMAAG